MAGDVQIDLESAEDANARRKIRQLVRSRTIVHVETRGVKFRSGYRRCKNGSARDIYVFPSGSGEAVGAEYKSEEGNSSAAAKRAHETASRP